VSFARNKFYAEQKGRKSSEARDDHPMAAEWIIAKSILYSS
jgi:hypothetical protein